MSRKVFSTQNFIILFLAVLPSISKAQSQTEKQELEAARLRGSINPDRSWWDVQHYDITIEPDFDTKSTKGKNVITYKVVDTNTTGQMQIDLQPPLQLDTVLLDNQPIKDFKRQGNVYYVPVPSQKIGQTHCLELSYSGHPIVGKKPPWDGGWTFTKDEKDRPWLTVTCQGIGASVWYPLKDHQSDEPDQGAKLTIVTPNNLVGVGNGRLLEKKSIGPSKTAYVWGVSNPINSYNIIPYIGHYVNFKDKFLGLEGELDVDYWVLDYNLAKAKSYFPKEVSNTLNAFEYWFGPYPFYDDGYKLVDTEHTGMEHQSAVAYGNHYKPGYRGRDLSGTGIGLQWDFIIVHESGHEWFGNNITTNDIADMYVHEGFTNYSETLFVEYILGKEAADAYNYGTRIGIQNDTPIIPEYGLNAKGSGDMYPKGGNMLHTIRHSIDNDKLFRNILAGLNGTFRKQTVDGSAVQDYISTKSNMDFSAVFDQYLTTTQIPNLEIRKNQRTNEISFRWTNCIPTFDLKLVVHFPDSNKLRFPVTTEWQTQSVSPEQLQHISKDRIERRYYVTTTILEE